jgi:ribosomal protein S12 methylthiotransferase accessory factor
MRFSAGVAIAPTRQGAITTSRGGTFRVKANGSSFVRDAMPVLVGSSGEHRPTWAADLAGELHRVGVLERVAGGSSSPREEPGRVVRVVAPRDTRFVAAVMAMVDRSMSAPDTGAGGTTLALVDLDGLDVADSLSLVAEAQRADGWSLAIWSAGDERCIGPLVADRGGPCWNCARLRFGAAGAATDTPTGAGATDHSALALTDVVVDWVLVAMHHPDLAARGRVLVDDGVASSLHAIVPIPWCEVCGGDPPEPALPPLDRSPLIPAELRGLADARGGVIREVLVFDDATAHAQAVPRCGTARIGGFGEADAAMEPIMGEGKGADLEQAIRSAIGEGIERYAASVWSPATLRRASCAELGDEALDPTSLVLYRDEQHAAPGFPYPRFDRAREIHWLEGTWLDTGGRAWLPAYATYMNFPFVGDEHFTQTTSNGLAAGRSVEDATLRALYELIERDAFMLTWLSKQPAERVGDDDHQPVVIEARRQIESLGAVTELYLVDVGTGHPTAVCVGIGDGDSWPGVTVGLGTDADIDAAVRKAVLEHSHFGTYLRRVARDGEHDAIASADDVRTTLDHARYYLDPARIAALDSFRAASARPTPMSVLRRRYRHPATLAACIAQLARVGVRTAAVDVTPPDVARSPLRVVRAFGTFLQPVHFGQAFVRSRNPRLEARLTAGLETEPHPVA